MPTDWSTALVHRSTGGSELAGTEGIWTNLREAVQITSYHPQANPNVISKKFNSRRGEYYVLKNTEEKTYLRLSASEFEIWGMMDGKLSVQDLIVEHYMKSGTFAHNNVIRLVQQLIRHQMLSERSVAVWSQVAGKVQSRSWLHRASTPARAILTQRLNINGIDKWITKLYKFIGWVFFTRPVAVIFILISIIGFIAYSRLLADESNEFIGANVIYGITTIWVVSILPVVIHELGHALTVKHYSREVPRGGLLLYMGMPAAFVETTDIWMEPRKARLLVTWNGPFTGLILGGAAAIFMYLNPESSFNNLLFKFASVAYFTVFFNINPLLKLDGYYLLADALDIPALRERSIAFVRQKLFRKLLRREKFSRDELVFSAFGLLSLLWTFYAIYLAVFLWRTRLKGIIPEDSRLVSLILNFLFIAAMSSLFFLIGLQLARTAKTIITRYSRSGILENHSRFALVLGSLSLLVGLGAPLLFRNYPLQISAALGVILGIPAAFLLFRYSRNYIGSPRGLALLVVGVGTILSSLSLGLRLMVDTSFSINWSQWTALLFLASGLVFISWAAVERKSYLIGLIFASLWFIIFELVLRDSLTLPFSLLSSLFLMITIGAVRSLRGSARSPAALLIGIGGLFVALSWMETHPFFDFAFTGILLLAAASLHLVYAKLPRLSTPGAIEITSDTRWSVGVSVGILIRRVIAQVFFESGFPGVERFGDSFSKSMQSKGVDIKIKGKVLYDNELPNRTTDELLEVYGLVFDVIYDLICRQFGQRMGTLTIGYGIDLLPWEYREVVSELILSRRQWGLSLRQQMEDIHKKRITLLKRVGLFSELSQPELDDLAAVVQEEHYAKGEYIIRQGEAGDKFYIIEHGAASVWQKTPDGTKEVVDRLGAGHYFGEVALISNAPRNASIQAETPLALLSLDRSTFDHLVKKYINLEKQVDHRVRYSWLLRGMPIFDELSGDDIDQLASHLKVERFEPNTVIFHQGDPGDKFYIVASGQLSILHEVDGRQVEVSRRRPGDYFGEIALIENRPRTATVEAIDETELLSMEAEYFREVISSFMHVSETLSLTGSRRLSMLQRVDAGIISAS